MDRIDDGIARRMETIENRGFFGKNHRTDPENIGEVEDDGQEAPTETQTIVMTGGKITEVINKDARNKVTRQLFVSDTCDAVCTVV